MERISEALFGLIMVLTITSSLSIATGDYGGVRTMLIGALGCNLAWGIIDAGMYLMARLNERGRSIMLLRAVREARDDATAHRTIKEALPPLLEAVKQEEGEHVEIYDHIGDVYLALGEKDKAIEAWQKGIKCAPVSKRDEQRKRDVEKKIKKLQEK